MRRRHCDKEGGLHLAADKITGTGPRHASGFEADDDGA